MRGLGLAGWYGPLLLKQKQEVGLARDHRHSIADLGLINRDAP